MTTATWQRVREIFDEVVELPPADQAAALDRACGEDRDLRAEVESLLEHHEQAGEAFLDSPGARLRAASTEKAPQKDGAVPHWARALIGRKVGRYELTRLIAAGGMGCVFEGRQEKPSRSVALKLLRPGLSAPSALARFQLEPELLARLQHPNIAHVHEAGILQDESGVIPFFAMELVPDARPLLDYAAAERLDTRQRLTLFAKVCDAVQHGHQKGIIHRDVKPANVLVGRDGEPKVIDFGVARCTDADLQMTQCTSAGELVGTVHYMSPEQCDGDPAAIDTRTDIYSLGVVLYELLIGQAPYDTSGTTVYGAVRTIRETPPRRPSELRPRLRGDNEAILLKALEKDPARRYASAAALAADIRRHLAGEPIDARPPSVAGRVVRWAVRHPLIVTGAACAMMLLVTVAATTFIAWYTSFRPDRLVMSDDRDVVWLKTASGADLHAWRGDVDGTFRCAELSFTAVAPSGGPVAIIGYGREDTTELRGSFALYDVNRDVRRPYLSLRLTEDDIPMDEIAGRRRADGQVFEPGQSNARVALVADVFPEPGHSVDELVTIFQHGGTTHSALCVYSFDGELLYRVWMDATICDLAFLSGPQLLILAGMNGAAMLTERDVPEEEAVECGHAYHPIVVFALRLERDFVLPRADQNTASYVQQEREPSGDQPVALRPLWYYCVRPIDKACCFAGLSLQRALTHVSGVDRMNAVHFHTILSAPSQPNSPGWPRTPPSRGWIIRGAEGAVEDSPTSDIYRMLEWSRDKPDNPLPPYNSWYLGDLPPIREGAPVGLSSNHRTDP